jgi:O-methyltransferase
MSEYTALDPKVNDYVSGFMLGRESPRLKELRDAAAMARPDASRATDPVQAQFLAWLVRLTGASNILEVGTFIGYSALAMAEAGGTVLTNDIDPGLSALAFTLIGRKETRISYRVIDATRGLVVEQPCDLIYIDSAKHGYPALYSLGLEALKPGGIMVFDNALMNGRVAEASTRPDIRGVQTVNKMAFNDPRVDATFVPLGDGFLIVRKL